jgi:hypothetical protein
MCLDQCYGSVKYSIKTDPDQAFKKIMDPEPDPEERNLQQEIVFDTVPDTVADQNPDPDLPDPHVFGPPGSGSGPFYH